MSSYNLEQDYKPNNPIFNFEKCLKHYEIVYLTKEFKTMT